MSRKCHRSARPPSARLEIPRLRRCDRREQAPVRLEVKERGAVDAVQPLHQHRGRLDHDQPGERSADRVGPHRRAQAEGAADGTVVGRALQEQVAAGEVQPVEHLDPLECLQPLQRRDPGREQLDPAHRPVRPPLPRRCQPRGPRRVDAADEHQPRIARGRPLDRHLVSPDLALAHHGGECSRSRSAAKPRGGEPGDGTPARGPQCPPGWERMK